MLKNRTPLLVDEMDIIPGHAGTAPVASVRLGTTSHGELDWIVTPRQARMIAERFERYAQSELPTRRRSRA